MTATPDTYQIDPRWRASHHGAGQWAVEHLSPRARRWRFVCWAPARGAPGTAEWLAAARRAGIVWQAGSQPAVMRAARLAEEGRAVSVLALPALRNAIAAAWLDGARGADLDAVAVAVFEKHQ